MSDEIKAKLDRIEIKIDKLDSRMDTIDITLANQAKDLEYHIKRSDMLEDMYVKVEEANKANTEHRLVQTNLFSTVGALVAFLSTLAGLLYTLYSLL